jgi:polyhydroxybutyrate depolymerase
MKAPSRIGVLRTRAPIVVLPARLITPAPEPARPAVCYAHTGGIAVRVLASTAIVLAALALPSRALAQAAPLRPCQTAPESGVTHTLSSGGRMRTYRLFIPPPAEGRTPLPGIPGVQGAVRPLVLDLHGSGGNAAGQARTSGFEALAAREGFVVATLQADGGRWNVPVTSDRPDDVLYAADVIDDVSARACIDTRRVYATGFSGGARMTSLLACRLGHRIAAIAPMAGLRWPGPCEGRAVPVLTFHGLADPQNTYAGHADRGAEWVESVPDALAGWAAHDHCNPQVIDEDPPGPLSTLRYAGCDGGAEVRLIRIDGLGHTWARTEIDATAAMWQFFRTHALE